MARVGPEEVAQEASVRNIGGAGEAADLIKGGEVGGEAAVHAEDLVVDEGGNREAVEAVREELPETDVEAALALVVETVDAVDGGALMVASQEEEVLRIPDFVGEQEADGLKALLPTVHVVTQE